MCTAWEGIGSLSACVSISRAAALIDEAIEAGQFATNQQCCYEGWLASLLCSDLYDVSTALPGDRVFTAMPDLCGQRTAKKCLYSDHSAGLVSEKRLPTSHTHADTHTLTSSASPFPAQPLWSHTTQAHRRTQAHTGVHRRTQAYTHAHPQP